MELKEFNEKIDSIATNIETIQKANEALKGKIEGENGLQAVIEKTIADVSAIQEARQAEEGEKAALKNTLETLEKKLARAHAAGDVSAVDQYSEYGNHFQKYLKKGIAISPELVKECVSQMVEMNFKGADAEDIARETKDLVVGSNPQGGYLVRPERSAMMIKRLFETSPMRQIANVVTMQSDSLEIIIDDNEAASGGWVGEVDPRGTTDTPQVGKLVIEAHEIFAQPRATQKFLDDAAIDVEGWLSRKVIDKISRDENTAFVTGDGALKPKGLLSYADAAVWQTYERGKIQTYTGTGTVGTLDEADDFLTLQNGLKEPYQANAVWGMKRSTFGGIITLKDLQGQYLFQSRMISEMRNLVLLGKPVIFMDDLPAVSADSLSVIYGDFSIGYTIADRIGFRVIRDEVTNKPYILFYTSKRTGGDVTSYDSWVRMRTPS